MTSSSSWWKIFYLSQHFICKYACNQISHFEMQNIKSQHNWLFLRPPEISPGQKKSRCLTCFRYCWYVQRTPQRHSVNKNTSYYTLNESVTHVVHIVVIYLILQLIYVRTFNTKFFTFKVSFDEKGILINTWVTCKYFASWFLIG